MKCAPTPISNLALVMLTAADGASGPLPAQATKDARGKGERGDV